MHIISFSNYYFSQSTTNQVATPLFGIGVYLLGQTVKNALFDVNALSKKKIVLLVCAQSAIALTVTLVALKYAPFLLVPGCLPFLISALFFQGYKLFKSQEPVESPSHESLPLIQWDPTKARPSVRLSSAEDTSLQKVPEDVWVNHIFKYVLENGKNPVQELTTLNLTCKKWYHLSTSLTEHLLEDIFDDIGFARAFKNPVEAFIYLIRKLPLENHGERLNLHIKSLNMDFNLLAERFPKLKGLDLSLRRREQDLSLDQILQPFKELRLLNLSDNTYKATTLYTALAQLKELEELNLTECQEIDEAGAVKLIDDSVVGKLIDLIPTLKVLRVAGTKVKGSCFIRDNQLRELDISECPIDDNPLKQAAPYFTHLKILSCTRTLTNGEWLKDLPDSTELDYISFCSCSNITPELLTLYPKIKLIKKRYFIGTRIENLT